MTVVDGRSLLTPEVRAALPIIAAILLAWFANIAFTGWLAGRRGRDDGLWAVFATLAGPIALLALLVLPRVAPEDKKLDVTWQPAPPLAGSDRAAPAPPSEPPPR